MPEGPYRLDTGDRLRIFVYGQPNLSRLYVVDQAGKIAVPLIGNVRARGKTTNQLQAAIRSQLGAEYVKDPQVTVDIVQNRPFFILGEVKAGGQFPYVSGMTVETAVAIAGGYTERASERTFRITRRVNGFVEQIVAPSDFAAEARRYRLRLREVLLRTIEALRSTLGQGPRMRILHCLRAPVGGLFRHVLDLAEEQAAHGHDVGILAASTTEDRLTSAKFAAIAPKLRLGIARIPINRQPGLSDLAAVRAVRAHAATLDLDVLHGHGAKGGAYARFAARRLSARGHHVKSFYTPHGGSLNFKPGSLEQRILLMIEGGLESMTSGLIFESAYAARVYRSRVSAKGAPQRIIPNGLKPTDFTPAKPRPDATDILFVGELRSIKGVDVLLKALAGTQIRPPGHGDDRRLGPRCRTP